MPVPLSTFAADCARLLNAADPGVYSGTITDPRWTTAQVVDAILHADSLVCGAIFKNPANARNGAFYATQFGVVSGGMTGFFPDLTSGPVASVVFVASGGTYSGNMPAVEWDMSEILFEDANPVYDFDPHYHIDVGQRIWHNGIAIAVRNGGSLSVNVVGPTFFRTGATLSPDEYAPIVLAGAMSMLVNVEGEATGPAGTWGQQFQAGLQMVMSGRGDVPQQQAA